MNNDYYAAKRAELEIWDGVLAAEIKKHVAAGMSREEAEERAVRDVQRQIRNSK